METQEKLPFKRTACPVSAALDIVGDKWTLVIIRTMFAGARRYGDLQKAPEQIPTNILASRLKELEANGLVVKRAYQQRPVRYEYLLTRRGADLLPVLQALARWSAMHICNTWAPPAWFWEKAPADFVGHGE